MINPDPQPPPVERPAKSWLEPSPDLPPPTPPVAEAPYVECDTCNRRESIYVVETERCTWTNLPAGWLITFSDDESYTVCSAWCAERGTF